MSEGVYTSIDGLRSHMTCSARARYGFLQLHTSLAVKGGTHT